MLDFLKRTNDEEETVDCTPLQAMHSVLTEERTGTDHHVYIRAHRDVIEIGIEGYGKWGDPSIQDILTITVDNGVPRLVCWNDINKWVPVGIDLDQAAVSNYRGKVS